MMSREVKQQVMAESRIHESDTGSAEVQIALLTHHIRSLTEHMKANPKDFHSRRGLLRMVGKRRKMLAYLKDTNFTRYSNLIQRLGLRH